MEQPKAVVSEKEKELAFRNKLVKLKREGVKVLRRSDWIRFEFKEGKVYKHQLDLIESIVVVSLIDFKNECITGKLKCD